MKKPFPLLKQPSLAQKFARERNSAKWRISSMRSHARSLLNGSLMTDDEKAFLRHIHSNLGIMLKRWESRTALLKEKH